jgi:hypothetical protein
MATVYSRYLFFFGILITIAVPAAYSGQQINITGVVTSHPFMYHPDTEVTAFDFYSGDELARTLADENGYFAFSLELGTYTDHSLSGFQTTVFSNPFHTAAG